MRREARVHIQTYLPLTVYLKMREGWPPEMADSTIIRMIITQAVEQEKKEDSNESHN